MECPECETEMIDIVFRETYGAEGGDCDPGYECPDCKRVYEIVRGGQLLDREWIREVE